MMLMTLLQVCHLHSNIKLEFQTMLESLIFDVLNQQLRASCTADSQSLSPCDMHLVMHKIAGTQCVFLHYHSIKFTKFCNVNHQNRCFMMQAKLTNTPCQRKAAYRPGYALFKAANACRLQQGFPRWWRYWCTKNASQTSQILGAIGGK